MLQLSFLNVTFVGKLHWQVIAKDYNSPLFRNHLWTQAIFRQAEILDIPRVVIGIASTENRIEYICDLSTWTRAHEALRARAEANATFVDDLIAVTEREGQKMNAWTRAHIIEASLTSLPNDELISLLKTFIPMQEIVYAYGVTLPLLDFQGFSFVEGNLEKILKAKVFESEYGDYYRAFTEPAYSSFAEEQEIALLELMDRFYETPGWKEAVAAQSFELLEKNFNNFTVALKVHAKMWGWVYYVYMGPAFTEKEFLEFIRDYLKKEIVPAEQLEFLKERRRHLEKLKQSYLEALRLTTFERHILELAGKIVWAKPRRKDYQSRSYWHVEKLQREIAQRLALTLDQVRSTPIEQLERWLLGEDVDADMPNTIFRCHVCVPQADGTVATLFGDDAQTFLRQVERPTHPVTSDTKELRGTSARPGQAKGRVKIVNTPDDMAKMEYGDILVSTATTPSIIAAMKRAAAIVTDEGGLTCHASIVSRELGIPCVIGTKIASEIFHDGDHVEVDATKGMIRKI